MPMPVSVTLNNSFLALFRGAVFAAVRSMVTFKSTRPWWVNLIALLIKFNKICRSRFSSPCQYWATLLPKLTLKSIDWVKAWCSKLFLTCSMSACRSNWVIFNCSMPWSILEKSKTLFTKLVNCWLAPSSVARWAWAVLGKTDFCSTSIIPKIPFKGVRTSWLMVVKKWPRASLACSACTLASCNSRVRWVTVFSSKAWASWAIFTHLALASLISVLRLIILLNKAKENITISAKAPISAPCSVNTLEAIKPRLTNCTQIIPLRNVAIPMASKLAFALPATLA